MEFEAVIGLEVHAQLTTASKIFCGSSTEFGREPNELTDPLTLGLPGSLPVLNRKVVEHAIMLGVAMNCEVRRLNRFARKHYFYPDLPKGYQISQFDEPICERGQLIVHLDDGVRTVGIRRIHMEEDAGKNIHDARTASSLIDLNRAGVPLLEIVSEPDIRTPSEASAYLRALRQILRYLGICDGNMEEGSMRCDANVSVRQRGDRTFGTRAELKNINSFKFVERGIEYETARQIALIKGGEAVVQETRLFDSTSGTTKGMRGKEESADYRYFPDPDLPPLVIDESLVENVRAAMPILPEQARKKLRDAYGLSDYDAGVLTMERQYVDYFEEAVNVCSNPKSACNWITSELFGYLNKTGKDLMESPVRAREIGELVRLIDTEVISGKIAKSVFEEMFKSGKSPVAIIEEQGLRQVINPDEVRKIVRQAIEQNQKQLDAYLGGKEALFGYFVGQAMKISGGSLSPKLVNELLKEELDKLKERE